jgi:CRISPR-associated protein Csx17
MSERLQVVKCEGIRPTTLGEYLSGLGLLAALSQRWPRMRGCWRDGCFVLAGEGLEAGAALEFLSGGWRPTPYERWWKGEKEIARARSKATLAQARILDCHIVSRGVKNVYNPILGSGGNVGRRDFAQVVKECLSLLQDAQASSWLRYTVFGGPEVQLPDLPSTGTWFAHANKAFNSGASVSREGQLSPWSYLFAMEGALLLSGGVNKRLSTVARPYGAFPFVTEAPAPGEAGQLGVSRAEFWAPDWSCPAALPELRNLLQRGLARVGSRAARTPADFATAALTAGAQAGLTGFHRFLLRQTTSGNTYESISSGNVPVAGGLAEASALKKIADWADALPRDEATQTKKRFVGLKGPVERALIGLAERPSDEDNWRRLLLAAADIQLQVDRNRALRADSQVLLGLDESLWQRAWKGLGEGPEWLASNEIAVVLARCIAGIAGRDHAVFHNIFGLGRGEQRFGKARGAHAVWSTGGGYSVLADILERRLLDPSGASGDDRAVETFRVRRTEPGLLARPEWVEEFLSGSVDAGEVSRLLPAFCLVNWTGRPSQGGGTEIFGHSPEYRLQALFRPLFADTEIYLSAGGDALKPRPGRARAVLVAMRGANWERAVDIARQAHQSVGVRIVDPPEFVADGERIAASLLIPMPASVIRRDLRRMWMRPVRAK